VLEELEQEP